MSKKMRFDDDDDDDLNGYLNFGLDDVVHENAGNLGLDDYLNLDLTGDYSLFPMLQNYKSVKDDKVVHENSPPLLEKQLETIRPIVHEDLLVTVPSRSWQAKNGKWLHWSIVILQEGHCILDYFTELKSQKQVQRLNETVHTFKARDVRVTWKGVKTWLQLKVVKITEEYHNGLLVPENERDEKDCLLRKGVVLYDYPVNAAKGVAVHGQPVDSGKMQSSGLNHLEIESFEFEAIIDNQLRNACVFELCDNEQILCVSSEFMLKC